MLMTGGTQTSKTGGKGETPSIVCALALAKLGDCAPQGSLCSAFRRGAHSSTDNRETSQMQCHCHCHCHPNQQCGSRCCFVTPVKLARPTGTQISSAAAAVALGRQSS